MAKILPLFPGDQRVSIERAKPLDTSAGHGHCRRCKLSRGASSVCIEPEIAQLGDHDASVLLVGEMPGTFEDRSDRPFAGKSGALLRAEVARHWKGRVVFDNALKCLAPRLDREKKQTVEYVQACQGYLAETLALAKPERVIALGSVAALALLGRTVPPYSVRRGYGFLSDGTPVYLGINPAAALRNRFVLKWFRSDLEWALTSPLPIPTQWDAEFTIVETREDAERAVEELRRAPWFAFDVETSGVFGDRYFRVLTLSCCAAGSDYPFVWTEEALNDPALSSALFDLFRDPAVKKVGHNVKFDVVAMHFGCKVDVRGIYFDTMHDRRALKADALARLEFVSELVGCGGYKREMTMALASACSALGEARKRRAVLSKTGGKKLLFLPGLEDPAIEAATRLAEVETKAFAMALVEPKLTLYRYVARDTMSTVRAGEHLRPLLARRGVEQVSNVMLSPAVEAYAQVEIWGMPFSLRNGKRFNEYLAEQKRKIEAKLTSYGMKGFDPSSRDQVEHMLFDVLGLKSKERDKTKSGKRGTGKKILKHHAGEPFVRDLLEFRRIEKLLGTYGEGMLSFVREDGRIHPNVKITGTETGRPSCEDPNLQNLPRAQSVDGAMARDCFTCTDDLVMVEADYSQIELRVAAMLSGDQKMIDAYVRGEDLHWRTTRVLAPDAWGMQPNAVTEKERSESKCVTFGLMYGKQDQTLAEELGISVEKAALIRKLVLGEYDGFAAWCEEQFDEGMSTGETWTWWAGERFRIRPIWQIGDAPERNGRPTGRAITARNSCVNTPIQGTASDYCLRSLIEVVKACQVGEIPAKVIITIHDAIMLECRRSLADQVARQVGEIMCSWPTIGGMPLVADFKIGRSWGSMKGFHPYHESKHASAVLAAMGC